MGRCEDCEYWEEKRNRFGLCRVLGHLPTGEVYWLGDSSPDAKRAFTGQDFGCVYFEERGEKGPFEAGEADDGSWFINFQGSDYASSFWVAAGLGEHDAKRIAHRLNEFWHPRNCDRAIIPRIFSCSTCHWRIRDGSYQHNCCRMHLWGSSLDPAVASQATDVPMVASFALRVHDDFYCALWRKWENPFDDD